jgi:hypothetical protein
MRKAIIASTAAREVGEESAGSPEKGAEGGDEGKRKDDVEEEDAIEEEGLRGAWDAHG